MKRFIVLFLAFLLTLSTPIEAYAIKKATVDNIKPRADLRVTVEPLPRKVDIVIENDNISPSWSEVEQLVNDNIVPLLEEEGIDYKITYNKPDNHKPTKFFPYAHEINNRFYWYRESYEIHSIAIPDGREIVDSASQYIYLDQKGSIYYIDYTYRNGNRTYYFREIYENSGLVRIFPSGYSSYLYGIDAQGNAYVIEMSNYSVRDIQKIEGLSNIVNIAGYGLREYFAVDKDGNLWSSNQPTWDENAIEINGHYLISYFPKVKEIALLYGDDEDDGSQRIWFVLTQNGEVYSWGSHGIYWGRTGSRYSPGKIEVEKIKKLAITRAEDGYSGLLAESGNLYTLRNNDVYRAYSNIQDAHFINRRLTRSGTIYPAFRMANPDVEIFSGDILSGFFLGDKFSTVGTGYIGARTGVGHFTIPAGERINQMFGYSEGGLYFVTESGKVYLVGRSVFDTSNGGLRLYDGIQNVENLLVVNYEKIHLALSKNGKVYVRAAENYNRNGQVTAGLKSGKVEWEELPLRNIKKIRAFGGDTTFLGFALDRNGDLWAWGNSNITAVHSLKRTNGMIQFQKFDLPFQVVDFEYFGGVLLVLNGEGELWSWGDGFTGHSSSAREPRKIEGIPKVAKLARIDATYDIGNLGFIDEDGYLWLWGYNYYGLITNSDYKDWTNDAQERYWQPVRNTSVSNVAEAVIGRHFIIIKRTNGSVQGWGRYYSSNQYTPIGLGSLDYPMHGMTKTLEERLDKITWRPNSDRYLIHISDSIGDNLRHNYYIYQIVNRLIPNRIKYIGLSYTDHNEMQKLVRANDNAGKVVRLTQNLSLNFRHVGQYIVQKQPIDIVFNLNETSKDNIKMIESKLKSSLVPQIEQYGYELRLFVTDGVRIPENRLYYRDWEGRISYYDPLTGRTRQIVNRPTEHAMIHHTGDLFYLERGTRNVYRYNSLSETETLFTVLPDYPQLMAVSKELQVWYTIGQNLYRYDPVTEIKYHETNYYYGFADLRPGANKEVLYAVNSPSGIYVAYPSRTPEYTNSYFQGETGCINYSAGFGYYVIGGSGSSWPVVSSVAAPAKGCDFIYYLSPIYGNNEVGYYNRETGRRITLYEGTASVITSTPIGDVYYRVNNRVHIVNYMTLERRTPSQSNFSYVIPYYFHNIETRRIARLSLTEGLQQAGWRPETDAYYVFMRDDTIPNLNSIADQLRKDKVSFIGLGTSKNKNQIEQFVTEMGHGTFIDTTDIDKAIAQLTNFILNQAGLPKYETNEDKVILEFNEETGTYQSGNLVWDDGYEDLEKDPKNDEHWIFYHDQNYYENPLGQLPEHGKPLSQPITTLTRTGLYEVHYEVSDLPKDDPRFADYIRWSDPSRLDVYAHRRPIADFLVQLDPADRGFYNLMITDQSYDLDRESTPTRGISEWRWRWKTLMDPDWNVGLPPSKINDSEIYMISLIVKDFDDAWSNEKIVVLYGDSVNNPPVAEFTVTPVIVNDDEYMIEDLSYDPDGDPIQTWHWRVEKEGVEIYNDSVQPTAAMLRNLAQQNGLDPFGEYTMTLRVQDWPLSGAPLWSKPYSQTFMIVKNDPPIPGFHWSPTLLYQGDSVQFTHDVDDPDKDTLRVRYQVTAPNGTVTYYPSATTWYVLPEDKYKSDAFTMSDLQGGDYIIQQTVMDEFVTRTLTKNMYVIPNRPPEPGFTWSPSIIWEGDTVQVRHEVNDQDLDTLQVRYKVTAPNGSVTYFPSSTTWYTINPSNYKSNAFQITNTIPGTYIIEQTVSDGKAPAVSLTKTFLVGELTINGRVKHTEDWNKNRKQYNLKVSGTEESPRTYDTFWAGESFVLEADTTDTAGSTTTAQWVRVTLLETGDSILLTSDNRIQWKGEMAEEDHIFLEDGIYNFLFEVLYDGPISGGVIKSDVQTIRIEGDVYDFFQIHRIN